MNDADFLRKQFDSAQVEREILHSWKPKMMDIKVIRDQLRMTPEGTPGELDSGMGFTCDTLELHWADNKTGVSCVLPAPGGDPVTYKAWIWFSPHLKRKVVRLEDMNGRKDCLIHNANFAGEAAGDETQIHGCTATGDGYGKLLNASGIPQFAILHSVVKLEALIAHIEEKMGDAPFTVTYSWG